MATEISRPLLAALRRDMDEALRTVAAKHGLSISTGNASFSPTSATFKVIIAVGEADANAKDIKAAADWKAYAASFGLKQEWLGEEFAQRGHTFRIIGLLPSRRANPVLARRIDQLTPDGGIAGKDFIFPADTIALHMGRNNKAKSSAASAIVVTEEEG